MSIVSSILYVHGFASQYDPESAKVCSLRQLGPVNGVTIDYTLEPEKVEQQLFNACMKYKVELLVGTSLGGYWAARVGSKLGIPFVSINPAITPNTTLMKYVGRGETYFGKGYILQAGVVHAYDEFTQEGCGLILLDMADELLDSAETNNRFKKRFEVHCFEGGSHRFSHMCEAIPLIKHFHHTSELVYGG